MYAHTPPRDDPDRWHDLVQHLRTVGEIAAEFAASFGASEAARLLGLTHDLAKADPRFQAYLRACHEGRRVDSIPHACPSAVAAYHLLGPLSLAVVGHHAGLPDAADFKTCADNADRNSVGAADSLLKKEISSGQAQLPRWAESRLHVEFLLRMLFSSLVDADYLDTEAHFTPATMANRSSYAPVSAYLQKLDTHLNSFPSPESAMNRARAEILAACRESAEIPPGAFRLTVPTGGGKTLSGLAFALKHACRHELRRVVVAIPYTSIIDQTAQVYGNIFGKDAILEHHSAIDFNDPDEEQSMREVRRKLAAENWDCPLIVTTTVQLFESLFSNRPGRCRKLHRLARSVIVLDEVQTLPPETLKPILDGLHQLVAHYGCTVVFCTATQPDYTHVDDRLFREAREIVSEYERYFRTLKRVTFVVHSDEWSVEETARRIGEHPQILAVLNSRRDALAVAQACEDADSVLHLSTLMCGDHRKRVIKEVKERLTLGQPIRLVSTQVVEAGVDFDFPIVMRDTGPLDRIIQVAGRCNRNGTMSELGTCVVFRLKEGSRPTGAYRTFTSLTTPLLAQFGPDIDRAEAMTRYFRDAFRYVATGSDVQTLREELRYRTVASTFRLIDDNTTPLIIEAYPEADVPRLVDEWGVVPPRLWFRRLAPYLVNVYNRDLRALRKDGLVTEHESGALVYTGSYHPRFGLQSAWTDPADLIA